MTRQLLTICVVTLLVIGCNNTRPEEPPVKPAPPLKPGVISLAPNNPYDEPDSTTSGGGPERDIDLPQAPDIFRVKFETTKGDFVVEVYRQWSPNGADRFYELVQKKFFDDVRFFRAVSGFMVQFGIHGDPKTAQYWKEKHIPDDPVVHSNKRGTITYAKPGIPHARTTQLFINYRDNTQLDADGFSPFGEIVEGMDVVDAINKRYGEEPSKYQQQIQEQGNAFLDQSFPGLDYIKSARLIEDLPVPADAVPDSPADATTPAN